MPKAQRRAVVESREERLAKLKAASPTPSGGGRSAGSPGGAGGSAQSPQGKKKPPGMPGMARRKGARKSRETPAEEQPQAAPPEPEPQEPPRRFDSALVALPDTSADAGADQAASGVVVDNEAAVLSRAGSVYLERASTTAAALELVTSAAGTRRPVVLLASSGAGKSTFLAQLVTKLRASGSPFDAVHAVFVGATDGSTGIHRICSDLLAALQRSAGNASDDDDDGEDGSAADNDFQSIAARLAARLAAAAEGRKLCLLFDAVNELDSSHAARSLR